MGNDTTIGFAASQGNFELNVFKPVIIYNFLQSVTIIELMQLLASMIIVQLELSQIVEVIEHNVNNSLMLVTALKPIYRV